MHAVFAYSLNQKLSKKSLQLWATVCQILFIFKHDADTYLVQQKTNA